MDLGCYAPKDEAPRGDVSHGGGLILTSKIYNMLTGNQDVSYLQAIRI